MEWTKETCASRQVFERMGKRTSAANMVSPGTGLDPMLAQWQPRPASKGPARYGVIASAAGILDCTPDTKSRIACGKGRKIALPYREGARSSKGWIKSAASLDRPSLSIGLPSHASTGKSNHARAPCSPCTDHRYFLYSDIDRSTFPGGISTRASDSIVSVVPKPIKA